ncbi:RDD family protein [Pseudobacillus badius]|uniref:RDD family protein n=1 Tax=Bacillus badius TaxID=1455 RepID=UPI0009EEA204|nr:RDD family protein [Bacillus badius]
MREDVNNETGEQRHVEEQTPLQQEEQIMEDRPSERHAEEKPAFAVSTAPALHYAGFWIRFWAYLLDLIVVGSLSRLLIYPLFRAADIDTAANGIFSAVNIATALVFYLYFVLMTKWRGQTIGKMVFGLKVISLASSGLSWQTVLFREWIGRYLSATIPFLYVLVAFLSRKQGLHDYFAETTVIHEESLAVQAPVQPL